MSRRCERCGAQLSRFTSEAVCPTCHASVGENRPVLATRPVASTLWLWSGHEASAALRSGDLGVILRTYRRMNGLSQERLAELLGYDKTYVSLIENHRRTIDDVTARRAIARALELPAHVLGVTDSADADFAAILQFGDSIIRLAELARQAGRAADAVNELWPLVARLEARAAEGHLDRDAIVLLGQARVALGVSLGTVLPEERLAVAARWTGKALQIARKLDDRAFLVHTLSMHGNELRKAEHTAAAAARLDHAVTLADAPHERGIALALLSRATGELGDAERFDHAITAYGAELDRHDSAGMLCNPFTFHEIHLRGLIATNRATEAANRAETDVPPAAPQWAVIERVTTGNALLAAQDRNAAEQALRQALTMAEQHRLPHQIQRIIRVAEQGQLAELVAGANASLDRLSAALALSAS